MSHSFLRKVSLFASLKDEELAEVARLTLTRTFARDELIILAEEEGDILFIIRKGRVKVSLFHEDGRELILSILGEGEVFGELALLDRRPRSANVVALEETELVVLRRRDFLQLLSRKPQIAICLLEELASRLRRTDHQLAGLALLDVSNRISQTLLNLAVEQGVETSEGILLKDRPTQQQLANMAGTTRETVSRVLKQLERQGYLSYRGKDLLILGNALGK